MAELNRIGHVELSQFNYGLAISECKWKWKWVENESKPRGGFSRRRSGHGAAGFWLPAAAESEQNDPFRAHSLKWWVESLMHRMRHWVMNKQAAIQRYLGNIWVDRMATNWIGPKRIRPNRFIRRKSLFPIPNISTRIKLQSLSFQLIIFNPLVFKFELISFQFKKYELISWYQQINWFPVSILPTEMKWKCFERDQEEKTENERKKDRQTQREKERKRWKKCRSKKEEMDQRRKCDGSGMKRWRRRISKWKTI